MDIAIHHGKIPIIIDFKTDVPKKDPEVKVVTKLENVKRLCEAVKKLKTPSTHSSSSTTNSSSVDTTRQLTIDTYLWTAIANFNYILAKLWLDRGANINQCDESPLREMLAMDTGSDKWLKMNSFLLEHGAKVKVFVGWLLYHYLKNNELHLADELLKEYPDLDIVHTSHYKAMRSEVRAEAIKWLHDHSALTPDFINDALFWTCYNCDWVAVKLLLDYGADVRIAFNEVSSIDKLTGRNTEVCQLLRSKWGNGLPVTTKFAERSYLWIMAQTSIFPDVIKGLIGWRKRIQNYGWKERKLIGRIANESITLHYHV